MAALVCLRALAVDHTASSHTPVPSSLSSSESASSCGSHQSADSVSTCVSLSDCGQCQHIGHSQLSLSSSSSSSSSSSAAACLSQLSTDCNCSLSHLASEQTDNSSDCLSQKRIRLSTPADTATSNQTLASVYLWKLYGMCWSWRNESDICLYFDISFDIYLIFDHELIELICKSWLAIHIH